MTPIETVKSYCEAVENMDIDRLSDLLAPDFSFEGPMVTFDGADAFLNFISTGPFESSMETIQMVADDSSVAHVYLFRMTAPAQAEIRMCEVLDVSDDRINSAKLFFDTAKFPMPMGGD